MHVRMAFETPRVYHNTAAGFAMALGLSRAGFRVAITAARDRAEIEAVAREAPPGQLHHVVADVCSESACAAVVEEVEARLGPVDALVNSRQCPSASLTRHPKYNLAEAARKS
jgi:NAD(P)-dependent dehydrogenase (short-subunit alcohol dehydrogenase family)